MKEKEATFLKAYDEHSDALFRFCYFKVSDRDLAKDLLQETFMKTWTYLQDGHEVENLRAFLYKTLQNLIIDFYRKKKSVSLDALQEDGFEPAFDEQSLVEDRIDGAIAVQYLKKIPAPYQEAVYMRFVQGLTLEEIATITGEPENTISVHVHRGLKKLRELFNRE
jgi:RNA polymerase sigma-70 factor (ECF subfamily)